MFTRLYSVKLRYSKLVGSGSPVKDPLSGGEYEMHASLPTKTSSQEKDGIMESVLRLGVLAGEVQGLPDLDDIHTTDYNNINR